MITALIFGALTISGDRVEEIPNETQRSLLSGLQLFVRIDGREGGPLPVEVSPDATVQDVIDQIPSEDLPQRQIVSFQGRALGPNEALSDAGIGMEAVINVESENSEMALLFVKQLYRVTFYKHRWGE